MTELRANLQKVAEISSEKKPQQPEGNGRGILTQFSLNEDDDRQLKNKIAQTSQALFDKGFTRTSIGAVKATMIIMTRVYDPEEAIEKLGEGEIRKIVEKTFKRKGRKE